MTQDDPREQHPQPHPDGTPGGTPPGGASSGGPTEETRPLSPYPAPWQPQPYADPVGAQQATLWQGQYVAPGATTTAPRRRRFAAAVLAGSLLVGGAAGVGGAAAYSALDGDGSSSGTTSAGDFEATKTAAVEDGTVEKVASTVLPSVVKVNVAGQDGAGSGSGIVLSKDGEILTNNHVVAGVGGDESISVSFNDGTTERATVVGTDPLVDIAVIKVQGVDDLTPASIGKSGALDVGQTVVAVGSPFGLNATVTSGIVSALNRPVSVGTSEDAQGQAMSTTYPAIQTDAAINPGNSGGPLVDMSGRVVGINSSIRTASSQTQGSQGGSIGLGFAIPIDEVLPIVNQIVDGQTPTHARLGVSVGDVSQDNTSTAQGALVSQVESGGAGAAAGLRDGDVITKVDDQVIESSEALVATIRGHRPGDEVTLTYLRDGKTATTRAELGSDAGTSTS